MPDERVQITYEELDKLLGHADGNAALLYLHIRRSGGFSMERAARATKCTEAELFAAVGTLRSLGLLEEMPSKEAPEYTAEDVAARTGADPAFEAVVREAERTLGHVLGSNDLKLLFAIYDYWGLGAEVIMVLLHHCVEKYQAASGAGRMPTMRYVEKEARYWAGQEVNTLDAAEELIRRDAERRALTGQVKEALQIRGRDLTAGERKYVEDWLALGFSPEAIAIAYDRTVLSTGKLAWKYMDKILRSWAGKGLYTPAAIEAGDARRGSNTAPAPEPRPDADKLEAMRRMYERMKEKNHG